LHGQPASISHEAVPPESSAEAALFDSRKNPTEDPNIPCGIPNLDLPNFASSASLPPLSLQSPHPRLRALILNPIRQPH
jgi:hypothetical protein